MRLYKVELGGFEPWLWADDGDLGPLRKSWTQQPGHWTLFHFEHDGIMSINNKPISYNRGNLGFVVPGTKVSFDRIGEGTGFKGMTFGLVRRTDTVAIPAVADLGDLAETRRREIETAWDWLHVSIMSGLAVAFNLLWSIAQPLHAFRKSDLVFDAEDLIVRRLGQELRIAEVASELGISHCHLLRLFREEHNCTIQEFVREKRAEVARHLIVESKFTIKEIAVKVGMPDLHHFNKVMRTVTGLSPRALREQAESRTRH